MNEDDALLLGLMSNDKRRYELLKSRRDILENQVKEAYSHIRTAMNNLAYIERSLTQVRSEISEVQERIMYGYKTEPTLRAVA